MDHLWIKLIHVLGAILFVGNIVVTALWKTLADRTRDPRIVAFGQRLVLVTDAVFTGPGAAAVVITGYLLLGPFGDDPFGTHRWIFLGLHLFLGSAVIWGLGLLPIQIAQYRMVRSLERPKADAPGTIPPRYWVLGRLWMFLGIVATLLPLIAVYFMVVKPS